jgi:hypothetical protein
MAATQLRRREPQGSARADRDAFRTPEQPMDFPPERDARPLVEAFAWTDDHESSMDDLNAEREKLMAWGETLYRDASRLEKEKEELERNYREEREVRESMERDNAHLAAQVQQIKYMGKEDVPLQRLAEQENSHIRKQLSTLSLEIGDLRRTRDEAMQQLQSSRKEFQVQDAQYREYQSELEKIQSSKKAMAAQVEETAVAAERERKQAIRAQKDLQEAQVELDVVQESLHNAREDNSAMRRRVEELTADADRREAACEQMARGLQDLEKLYLRMREAFDAQTREYEMFAHEMVINKTGLEENIQQCYLQMESVEKYVKVAAKGPQASSKKQKGASASTPDATDGRSRDVKFSAENLAAKKDGEASIEEQEAKLKKLEEEVKAEKKEWHAEKRKLMEENEKLKAKLATYRTVRARDLRNPEKFPRRRENLILAPPHDFIRTLWSPGLRVDKFNTKGTAKPKTLTLGHDLRSLTYRDGMFSTKKYIELHKILRIEFGSASRAAALDRKLEPWKCISLYLQDKSVDFHVADAKEAKDFVLAISRICPKAEGRLCTVGAVALAAFHSRLDYRNGKEHIMTRSQLLREKLIECGELSTAGKAKAGAGTGAPAPRA